jgi:hypothetical protein
MDAGLADASTSVALRATGRGTCRHRPYTGAAWIQVSMATYLAHAPPSMFGQYLKCGPHQQRQSVSSG